VGDRAVLEGILFVLETGVPWKKLPVELGFGSGEAAGVWDELHQRVLDRLGQQGLLDWSRAALDSVSVRAKKGGADRAQPHWSR
jgi:transposase